MDPSLESLYRETLLKHSREPKNQGVMKDPDAHCEIRNPLCGDVVSIYLEIQDEKIVQAKFDSQSCTICTASASMLTEKSIGYSLQDSIQFVDSLVSILNDSDQAIQLPGNGDILSLSGVKAFPSRIRCATLPWEALKEAIVRTQ